MAEDAGTSRPRRTRRRTVIEDETYGPAPAELHPNIANLRGKHRAAHPDGISVLNATSHQLVVDEWQITCPRFVEGLRIAGVHCLTRFNYIRLDHHLLTALVERWCPNTNTFHLAVGEMTITLQDVAMILGLIVDGPPIISQPVVGGGRRWPNWPDCCDDLLGTHPNPDHVYYDPGNPQVTSKFRMGQASARTCVPLRWLRWTFQRESYVELNDIQFRRHVRAYILFLIGALLMPDTSGSEVHLQYLPLLEDLELFGTLSLGSAVLAHLYRELTEATKPSRTKISGCIHLLQIWSWEHLHIGRPILHVPEPELMYGYSVGLRWSCRWIRDMPYGNVMMYRDEFDGLLQSQVIWEPYTQHIISNIDDICSAGEAIWLARVPIINWKRVEWYLPDRVLRQFGCMPIIDVSPVDPSFVRVDGRGKADVDWMAYHHIYIELWENRRASIVPTIQLSEGRSSEVAVKQYMTWYQSWATLFLLKAPSQPPDTYYARAATERRLREAMLQANQIFQPFFGRQDDIDYQQAINKFEELMISNRRDLYISDTTYEDVYDDMGAGPSSRADPSTSQPDFSLNIQQPLVTGINTDYQQWPGFELNWAPPDDTTPPHLFFPAPTWNPMGSTSNIDHVVFNQNPPDTVPPHNIMPIEHVEEEAENALHRQRRAPDRYTPGSRAIPRRRAR